MTDTTTTTKDIQKAKDAKTAALATVGENKFAILLVDPEETKAIVRKNLGDGGMDSLSLDRIPMPSGGGQTYMLPTLEGDKLVEEIVGVIIAWQDIRAYWESAYDGSKNPPTCSAADAKLGIGDPGGNCAACSESQFGSKVTNGKPAAGQACNECRRLFVLTPDDRLPLLISLPPTSVKGCRKYFQRLASKGVPYYGVVTKIGLSKEKNSTGIEYSQATLGVAAILTADQVAAFEHLHEVFAPKLSVIQPIAEDYATEADADSQAAGEQSAADAADEYDAEVAATDPQAVDKALNGDPSNPADADPGAPADGAE